MIQLTSSGGLKAVVDDASPQLGGDLDGRSLYDLVNMVDGTFSGVGTFGNVVGSGSSYPVIKAERLTALTNAMTGTMMYKGVSSGNMTDGFGASMEFVIEDNSAVRNRIVLFGAARDGADGKGRFTIALNKESAGVWQDVFTIRTTGKMGIGTTNPAQLLHLYQNTASSIGLQLENSEGSAAIQANNGNMYLQTDDDATPITRMVIDKDGNIGIGVTDPHSKLEVAGAISSATLIITASSDVLDVSGVNTVFINISADIVLGGLVGGVDGQAVTFAFIGNFVNHCRFEHAEGIGGNTQDFINHTSADEDIDHGGCVYVCNGTNWYDVSHAKHV